MMRRGYIDASVHEQNGGWGILLDGKRLLTPGGRDILLPTQALADAVAAEWAAQGEVIHPASMPFTRLANVAVERTPMHRAALADEMRKYGETDLLLHRAEEPQDLVRRQSDAWDPVLAWARSALQIDLPVVQGVIAPRRNASRLAHLALQEDDFTLTALCQATALFGSAILAFAVAHGRHSASEAFHFSRVDESYQSEHWGEDAEAARRTMDLAREAEVVGRFLTLLRA